MGPENINIKVIFHHFQHLVIYSFVIWQIYFAILLLLKWINSNWKIKKTFSVVSPSSENNQPIINIDGSSIKEGMTNSKKDMGAIDVDFKKDIFIDKEDSSNVKLDKVKKGNVKTQKNKLKKLRGG
tara:strand:+ start:323 stop:700 length:378 start_codon:yes stop_codon:yes gene_type:complete